MNTIREFINDNCIFRCPPGYFLKGIPAGHAYSWQFYLRKAIFHKVAGPLIAEWLAHHHVQGVQYAAMESAGPAMLSAMQTYAYFDIENGAEDSLIPGFSIRKNQKEYGLFNWIEGCPEDLPVVIIDDIANSKTTINRAKEVCESYGLEVIGAITIVNKTNENEVDDLPVVSMFTLKDFDLTWESYYNNKTEPNVSEFVELYKDLLLKSVLSANGMTVLESVNNPALLAGFNEVDIISN